jgi:hypothetical protein
MAFDRMRFCKEQAMSNIVYVSKAHGETGTYQPRFSVSLFCRVTYSLDQSWAQPTNGWFVASY